MTASIIGDPTRPYNGNANATLTSANYSLLGLVGSNSFTLTKSMGTYNSSNVASANTVAATLSAGDFVPGPGTMVGNYVLPTSASGPGHITAVTLTASIIGDPTRPYNGNTNATLASANYSLMGLVSGESITVTQTAGTYNSKDVVTANTVSANLASGDFAPTAGTLASNYVLPTTASGPGHITPAPLDIAADPKTKAFGQGLPAFTVSYMTLVAGDTPTSLGGVLSCSTTAVVLSPVGNYPITCGGQTSTNYTITYQPGTLTITQATTSATVSSSPNPSILNAPVTFTATVTPQFTGVPTGTVTFKDGAITLGTGVLDGTGHATFTTSTLTVNAHTINAVYSGDANFVGSSASTTQTVQYTFVGFLPPIDNLPIVNSTKAGQTVPIKWQLKDANGNLVSDLGSLAPNGLVSGPIVCMSNTFISPVEELSSPGSTVFRFDGTQFIYNWQTLKSYTGCRLLQVKLADGTVHEAMFQFK